MSNVWVKPLVKGNCGDNIHTVICDLLIETNHERHSSRFSSNYEAFTSELLKNLEDMFYR